MATLAPYDDVAAELYVRTLAENGDVAAALLYYQEYRRRLHEDMSVDVTRPSLLQLVAQINRPHVVRETLPDLRTPPATTAPRADRLVDRQIVGRTRERARLEQLLDRGDRLISVTGMGGIGKTAFVRSRLHDLSTRCAGRLYTVDCRGHRVNAGTACGHAPPHHCRRCTLTACGRHGCIWPGSLGAGRCARLFGLGQLRDAGRGGPDGGPVAGGAAGSDRHHDHTSRPPPQRRSDHRVARAGHAPDGRRSAGRLFFVQRVRQERMDFAPTRGRPAGESICRRLGGHPLAIELAAAQLDFFGLAELRELTDAA
ncbi:MAG: hypothetical protein R2854_24115 [Caldilineaceae bacterium]